VLGLLEAVFVGEGWVAPERAVDVFHREMIGAAGTVLVASDGPSVLGVVVLLNRGSPLTLVAREHEAEFRLLAVDPRGRGRGVGERLVSACIERAARPPLSATRLVLWTQPGMTSAQRLYQRTGFCRAPERDLPSPPPPSGRPTLERWAYVRPL
jgi:ribosomal protein S18 acetylase RimI-like enzyme